MGLTHVIGVGEPGWDVWVEAWKRRQASLFPQVDELTASHCNAN